ISDLEPLDGGSGTEPRRRKSKRRSKDEKDDKERKEKKRDRSSMRHERHSSRSEGANPESVVLISPSASRKRVTFYDPVPDAIAMRDALAHTRHIDTKVLIQILPHLPSEDILAL